MSLTLGSKGWVRLALVAAASISTFLVLCQSWISIINPDNHETLLSKKKICVLDHLSLRMRC